MSSSGTADHAWWLASRASGVVALALVTVSVGLGLALSGLVFRNGGSNRTPADRREPSGSATGRARTALHDMRRFAQVRSLVAVHEQTALAGLVAIAVHGITLMGDRWLHPGVAGVAVPFASAYRPGWTGLGVVAGYLAALLGLSFYVRKHIGARLWRRAHRLTIVVYVLAVIHTLGAGTDAGSAWLRWSILVTSVPILGLFLARVRPRHRRPAPAATHHRPSAGPLRGAREEAA